MLFLDDHKANHHSQEKSHQNRNEKSHVLDRHKETETRIRSSSYFKHLSYRDRNQHCHVICNGSPCKNLCYLFKQSALFYIISF